MPTITTVNDVKNEFLSRRELVCDFHGSAGTLKKLDAVDAVTKEHSLEGKLVIPVRLQNHVGKTHTTATFFVYDDEALAKKHIPKSILDRIEKLKTAKAESEKAAAEAAAAPKEEAAADAPKDDKPADAPKDEGAAAGTPKSEDAEPKATESKPKEGAE